MCGISGLYVKDNVVIDRETALRAMLPMQKHRGPDASGLWLSSDGSLGLAHNRLAILDLSPLGCQPMASMDKRYYVVFNGEIYNYRTLRTELESLGARFRSQSDTEILLEAWRVWGEEMVHKLRGMFAFALYDTDTKTLFCARDPIGKKPFVYAETASGFVFASEIPAVLATGLVHSMGLNKAALAAMLLHNLRHIPDPYTMYEGIKRLRAGHAMMVRGGRIERLYRYFTPRQATGPITPEALREKLEEAVRLRLQSDVPLGALLSGGVDSSAIVALMTRLTGQKVRTYAMGLDAQDEDLRRARLMADHLGCEHRVLTFDPHRQWAIFERMQAVYGEPIMLMPLIHAYELCEAIHDDGVRVVLGGHGADELFYGYTGHIRTAFLSFLLGILPRSTAGLAALLPMAEKEALAALIRAPRGQRKASLYRLFEREDWGDILASDVKESLVNIAAEEMTLWGELCPTDPYIDESNLIGLMVEDTHSVTISSDLPAMMASVEMRAPFLDAEVMAFAWATPVRAKVPWLAPARRLKWILRQAVSDLVPHELLYAPKRGFGFGISEAQLLRGAWADKGDALFDAPFSAEGLFDPAALREMWHRFKEQPSYPSHRIAKLFAIQYGLQAGERKAL